MGVESGIGRAGAGGARPTSSAARARRVSLASPTPSPVQGRRSPAGGGRKPRPGAQAVDMTRFVAAAVLAVAAADLGFAPPAQRRGRSPTARRIRITPSARPRWRRSRAATRSPRGGDRRAFWGAVPCGGKITIVANSPLAPGLQAGTDGWVTFNSSLGADNLDAPASTLHRLHDHPRPLAVGQLDRDGGRLGHVLPDGRPTRWAISSATSTPFAPAAS